MNGLMKSYAEVLAAMGPDRPTAAPNPSKPSWGTGDEMNLHCSRGWAPPELAPKGGLMEGFMRTGPSIRLRGVYAPRVPHKTSMRQIFEESLMRALWSESFSE